MCANNNIACQLSEYKNNLFSFIYTIFKSRSSIINGHSLLDICYNLPFIVILKEKNTEKVRQVQKINPYNAQRKFGTNNFETKKQIFVDNYLLTKFKVLEKSCVLLDPGTGKY